MKKRSLLILTAIMIAALFTFSACEGGSSDDPGATLSVTVNYQGNYGDDYDTQTGYAGQKINYVQLYSCADMPDPNVLPTTVDGDVSNDMNDYLYSETAINNDNNTATDITGIEPGDYYVIAFYDYRTGGDDSNLITKADRYAFYDGGTGSPLISDTQKLTITEEGPNAISLTIQRNWEMGSSKTFITSLTGNTMTINVDYSSSGAYNAYAFVYRQLESNSPRNNILYQGNIVGNNGAIVIDNILTNYSGNFYVVCLLNSATGGSNIINTGDLYEIYHDIRNGTTGSTVASTATISEDDTIIYTIGDGATWAVTP
ncbi:MAG: hypothetical protein CVV44_03330 [Spirochaetae bacterium HGW-Spirochaetae-1]|jgi:hypothetical protein|nr:MAG: hypothetical protein CVV44_03330 [Spirochaetae bacterium HGW-Spirochaetae-1]